VTTQENDPFVTFDAAYVLGSLSPEDRHEFELHLRECPECSRSVGELAGLPGLLSQVHSDMVASEPLPTDVLPAVLNQVRRSRRRRSVLTVASMVAAVAACVALAVTVAQPRPAPDPAGTAMTALGAFPVQADIGLTDQAWGTRVVMSCSYRGGKSGEYILVAVRRDGGTAELASWNAIPQDTAEVVVGTALRRGDIKALEVRTRSGLTLLRLSP
jgi:hypothetical protein